MGDLGVVDDMPLAVLAPGLKALRSFLVRANFGLRHRDAPRPQHLLFRFASKH